MNITEVHSEGEATNLADGEEPVAIAGMPEEVYHARPELSASGMKVLLKSPKHFKAQTRVRKTEFDVGHAAHMLVLGVGNPVHEIPDELLSGEYRSISSAAAKAHRDEWEGKGYTVLKPEPYAKVKAAAESVLANPKARKLLEAEGYSEVSVFARDPETGLALRSRFDRVTGRSILDLKTTTRLDTQGILRTITDYNYDLSAEVYRFMYELVAGEVPEPMTLIFCEKEPPYDVRTVRLADQAWMDGGWQKFRMALASYAECLETRRWPGIDEEEGPVEDLTPPTWYSARVNASNLEEL